MTLPTKKIPELVELVTPGEADVLAVEDLALLRTSKITVANLRASMTAGYATTAYVDAVLQGLSIKASVRVATTGGGSLATAYAAGETVDGVVLVEGDRILIKDDETHSLRGIYVVEASGAPTRAEDFDEDADVTTGAYCFVQEGTVNGDSGWVLTTDNPIVIGTTSLAFAQFSGAGQIEVGDGLAKTGNLIELDPADGSIVTSPSGVAVGVINFDQHGAQTEPSLHAVASDVANGFMSSADKVKLDGIATGAVADHGALSGLSDDDHAQYLLVDGTRSMTATLLGYNGTAALPAFAFADSPTTGFYRSSAGRIGVSNSGNAQWEFQPAKLEAQLAMAISQGSAGAAFSINGNLTTGTLTSSLLIGNGTAGTTAFTGSSGVQRGTTINYTYNQSGTAGSSMLVLSATNTALGSGAHYFLDARAAGIAGATIFAVTNGSTAATQGRVLAGVGALTTPTYSFIDSPTSGLYRYAADAIGIALAGSAKFAFSGNYLYANQSLGGLSSTASNNAIGIRTVIGNSTTGIGLLIDNSTTFTATSGGQSHVEIRSVVNQAASTAGFSGLKVNLTNTALGSGAQYLADFQIAGTTVAGITNGSTAATQGRVLAGYGATATPGWGFLGDDTVGIVRTSAGTMGIISQSAERWRFEGGTFYAMANGAAIRQNVANGSLIIYGNITSATDDRAGIQIINVNNMSGASGSARHVMIENNINQSGTAGYTVLDVVADEVGTGSGAKYLINAKAGAGGTSQKFAVMNDGGVRIPEGTLTSAALGFLSSPDTGIVSAAALGAPGVPSVLFMVDGVFAGGFIDEAGTGDVQFRAVSGSLAVPSLAIDQNDLGFYAPSGSVVAAVAEGAEVFRWTAPSGLQPQLLVTDGGLTKPSIASINYPGSGFRWSGSGDLNVVIGSTDRLTIGTSTVTASGIYRTTTNGTASSPAYEVTSGSGCGMFNTTSACLSFAVEGSPVVHVDKDENTFRPEDDVGINLGASDKRWDTVHSGATSVRTYGTTLANAAVTTTAMCQVTANLTPVTAETIAIPANSAVMLRVHAVALNTAGSACGTQVLLCVARNLAGTVTMTTAASYAYQALDATATTEKWTAEFSVSGTNLLVRAKKDSGATAVRWQMTIERQFVTTTS